MSTTTTAASPEKAPMREGVKILCVGDEMTLLRIRCEVLTHAGYSSQTATVKDAAELIGRDAFDLVIVSAFLSEADQQRVLSAVGDTPALVLQGIAIAPELLAAVEAKLATWQHMLDKPYKPSYEFSTLIGAACARKMVNFQQLAEGLKMGVTDLMSQCNAKAPPSKALVKGLDINEQFLDKLAEEVRKDLSPSVLPWGSNTSSLLSSPHSPPFPRKIELRRSAWFRSQSK